MLDRYDVAAVMTAIMLSAGCAQNRGAPSIDTGSGDQGVEAPIDAPVAMDAAQQDAGRMDADALATDEDVAPNDRGPNRMILDFGVSVDAVPAPQSECGDAGTLTRPGDPSIAPPRPVLPQSASRASSWRPSFRWLLPDGVTGARVEICRDRCCTQVIRTLDGDGTSVRPSERLPGGVVFWRLFGRRGTVVGSRSSATWEVNIPFRDTPVDTSAGVIRDIDGDGFTEVLARANPDPTVPWFFLVRYRNGALTFQAINGLPRLGTHGIFVDDYNGDGLADAIFAVEEFGGWRIKVMLGTRGSFLVNRVLTGGERPGGSILVPGSIGDFNGDGIVDLMVGTELPCIGTDCWFGPDFMDGRHFVYLGSPDGLVNIPQWLVAGGETTSRRAFVANFGDANGNGLADALVADVEFTNGTHSISRLHLSSLGERGLSTILELPRPPGWGSQAYDEVLEVIADIDGDARSEILLLDRDRFVLLMSRSGYQTGVMRRPFLLPNDGRLASFGTGSIAVDLDGDGYRDLVVRDNIAYEEKVSGFRFNQGRLYIYRGSESGIAESPVVVRAPPEIASISSQFGVQIVDAGDLNQDGFDDLVIRALRSPARLVPTVGVCVLLGRSGAIPSLPDRCAFLPERQGDHFQVY